MNKFVRNIPNIISIIRIILAVVLIFLEPFSLAFFIVYTVGGVSDVLDGFIARRLNITSRLGSILDSVGDLLFYSALAVKIVPKMIELLSVIAWIIILACVCLQAMAYVICAIKYKKFSAVHTYANKIQSLSIFLFPFTLIGEVFWLYTLYVYILGAFNFYASVEINLIHLFSRRYDERNKSIFLVRKNEKESLE
jgi:CDP-diacylglycerol--glycerol-3-phosphate 3-phosphatidyltransferase